MNPRMDTRGLGTRLALLSMAAWLGWGCGGDAKNKALVQVGEVAITELDLREYRAGLPKNLRPTDTGEPAIRDLLQSLVSRQIMAQEARAKGLEQDSALAGRLQRFRVQRLAGMVIREDIAGDVQVSEEEIQQAYKEDHWDQQHRPAHILTATEAEARQVLELLKQGRDFGQLARERSLKDGERGGDLGQYFGPADVVSDIGAVVLGVPAGEMVGPIHTRDGYEVIKILDVQSVPLETVRAKVRGAVFQRKFMLEREHYLERLEAKHGVVYHREGIDALIAAGKTGGVLDPAQQDLPLLTWNGRVYTAAQGRPVIHGRNRPAVWSADSANVVWALRMQLLADSLLVAEAREQGLDRRPEVAAYLKERQERLLVDLLRRREVLEALQPTEEEIRQAYEADKEQYRVPSMAEITEVVVATEAQAKRLLGQARSGADMAALARQHSLRPGSKAGSGRLRFYEGQKAQWGPLYEPLLQAGVGDVVGPFKVERWWGIYRVDSRVPARMSSLEEVRERVAFGIRKAKEPEATAAYLEGLRLKYQDRITWYDKRIAELAASGAFASEPAEEPLPDAEGGS